MIGGLAEWRSHSVGAGIRRANLLRFGLVALASVMAIELAWMLWSILSESAAPTRATIGYDFSIYVERTQSWLNGEGFYKARQLAGPYAIERGDALYPPPAILLFLPWALGAPAILWWAVPLTIAAASLWRIRPPWWSWLVLAAVLTLYPRTFVAIVLGNPSIWAFSAVLAGAAFGWPAVIALLKPALAPLALVGAYRRSWWIAQGGAAVLVLAIGPMGVDYVQVLRDARYSGGYDYVLGEIPIGVALAVVGVAANRRRLGRARVSGNAGRGHAAVREIVR
jgi:hypothetical protein